MSIPAYEQLRVLVQLRDSLLDTRPFVEVYKRLATVKADIGQIEAAYRVERALPDFTPMNPHVNVVNAENKVDSATAAVVKLAGQIENHIHRLEHECLVMLDQDHPDENTPEYRQDAQQILAAACPNERAGVSRIDGQSQIIREESDTTTASAIADAAEQQATQE